LLVFGERFWIVDPYENSPRRDILAALDRYFLDPSVDARSDIKPRRIGLALHEQRLRPQEKKEGKPDNNSRNDSDDRGRSA
jgi:hypothetical protein